MRLPAPPLVLAALLAACLPGADAPEQAPGDQASLEGYVLDDPAPGSAAQDAAASADASGALGASEAPDPQDTREPAATAETGAGNRVGDLPGEGAQDGPQDGARADSPFLAAARAACEEEGGRFGTAPGGTARICFRTPADANSPCDSADDCEGVCLARSRTCAPIIPLFGCHDVLLSNGMTAEECVN